MHDSATLRIIVFSALSLCVSGRVQAEPGSLFGKWRVIEHDGKKVTEGASIFHFQEGGGLTVYTVDRPADGSPKTEGLKGFFSVAEETEPQRVIMSLVEDARDQERKSVKGHHTVGILKLDGDRLMLKLDESGKLLFPSNFEVDKWNADLMVMERMGAGKPKAAFEILKLTVSPNPVRRGTRMEWVVEYATQSPTLPVAESWTLLRDGEELFRPRKRTFEVRPGHTVNRVPFDFPSGDKIPTGKYTVRVEAGIEKIAGQDRPENQQREFTFEVK